MPLFGHWDLRLGWRAVPAVVAAVVVIAGGPTVARSVRWRTLIVLAALTTVAWSVSLALVDGWPGLVHGVESQHEYLPFARSVSDIPQFLRGFTDELPAYPTHVKGHPPGMVVILALLDRVGLAGRNWAAALVIAGGAAAVVSVLALLRLLADERAARRAAPFLAAAPAAIWIASSADALFAGVALSGVALLAVSRAGSGRRSGAAAASGGALLGLAVHLSYGLVLVAPLAVVALWGARRRVWEQAVVGGFAVTGAFALCGFAWWSGLAATRRAYLDGAAANRPMWFFVVANLSALAFAVGPAVAAGLGRLRGRCWLVVGPVLLAVVLADLSGMSKGEVERIWLFLAIPLVAATGAVRPGRRWLGIHVLSGLALALSIDAGW